MLPGERQNTEFTKFSSVDPRNLPNSHFWGGIGPDQKSSEACPVLQDRVMFSVQTFEALDTRLHRSLRRTAEGNCI